jgi:hypothetical protein
MVIFTVHEGLHGHVTHHEEGLHGHVTHHEEGLHGHPGIAGVGAVHSLFRQAGE